eukprot:443951-Rhodomonas_salina.2
MRARHDENNSQRGGSVQVGAWLRAAKSGGRRGYHGKLDRRLHLVPTTAGPHVRPWRSRHTGGTSQP